MTLGYFQRVSQQSETRLWINNPTVEEARKAIPVGAIGCTTNPTYTAKMLNQESERARVLAIIDAVLPITDDDSEAASEIQRRVMEPIVEIFRPLYEEQPGQLGYVSIQGDPFAEDDYQNIIDAALKDRELGENVIAKIPTTASGLKAMEYLIGENVPIIATEIMGIAQAISVCEIYELACQKYHNRPPMYVTHITGIFDEFLAELVKLRGIEIAKDLLWQAGTIIARKQYRVLKERGYNVIMLGGGARGIHHFTEFVGSDMHITINWSGAIDKLLELDPPVVYRMDTPIPDYAVRELLKIPEFEQAYREDGLKEEEFADFGPVRYFRDSFEAGWGALLTTINERRRISAL